MSAELVDPFATPIRAVWSKDALDQMESQLRYFMGQQDDSDLFPDIARKAVHDLHEAATTAGHPAGLFAGRLLEQLWHRAETRVPYAWGEQEAEPAWSLDGERGGPR